MLQPIQRVCKYPLLFAELLRNTSAVDDADSEATIGKVLGQLKLITHDINNATNDPLIRARIQRSWQLQKLLLFPKEVSLFSNSVSEQTLSDYFSLETQTYCAL